VSCITFETTLNRIDEIGHLPISASRQFLNKRHTRHVFRVSECFDTLIGLTLRDVVRARRMIQHRHLLHSQLFGLVQYFADFVALDNLAFLGQLALGQDTLAFHALIDALVKATCLTLATILTCHNAIASVGTDKLARVFDRSPEEALAAFACHRIEMVAGGTIVADDANLELVVIRAGQWQIVFVVAHLHFGGCR